MKSFSDWMEETHFPIRKSALSATDDKKINKLVNVSRRAAEKYTDKLIDALWRVANDKNDDEIKKLLSDIDPSHLGRIPKKPGFGFEDDDKREPDDVVPSSADSGRGEAEGI